MLPIGSNLYQDIQTDYLKQLELRVKRKQVLFAKWLAAFVSGAVTVTLPLLLSLLLYMSFLPVTKMYSGGTAAIGLVTNVMTILFLLITLLPVFFRLGDD